MLSSFDLIADITHTTEQLIGKGGSSRVYKGCLPDGKELAVKILKHSEDVMNEFISEIEIITALHHKNIISLFGFCFENKDLVLVYDFLSRGSLEDNLHGRFTSITSSICRVLPLCLELGIIDRCQVRVPTSIL